MSKPGTNLLQGTLDLLILKALALTEMPDRVVWLPLNSIGSAVNVQLGVPAGGVVSIGRAER